MHPIVRAAYPADRTSVARARRFVRETLIGWGAGDATDDAVLLTSELATNAVVHARTDADEFDEDVEGELVGGALVTHDVFGALGGIRVDEPGAASAR